MCVLLLTRIMVCCTASQLICNECVCTVQEPLFFFCCVRAPLL